MIARAFSRANGNVTGWGLGIHEAWVPRCTHEQASGSYAGVKEAAILEEEGNEEEMEAAWVPVLALGSAT
jgi:hypothetical protein